MSQVEIAEWMKPDALCDRACMSLCTKGFTQFPECATKREWVEPDEQDLLNVYNQFTDSDGWTYEKAIIKMCKELNT